VKLENDLCLRDIVWVPSQPWSKTWNQEIPWLFRPVWVVFLFLTTWPLPDSPGKIKRRKKTQKTNLICHQEWWHTPVNTVLRRLRWEDNEFVASLAYTMRLCLKTKRNKTKTTHQNKTNKQKSQVITLEIVTKCHRKDNVTSWYFPLSLKQIAVH
jgi:hypothetical protein